MLSVSSMSAKSTEVLPMFASTPGPAGPLSMGGGGGGFPTSGYPGRSVPPPVGTPGGGPNSTPTSGLPGAMESALYGPSLYAAAAAAAQAYLPFAAASESSAFYPHHINGDGAVEVWRNFSAAHAHHSGAGWPYDPAVISYPYGAGYGALDVRRKNATRESTSTLKAWLYEHIKNPYPTKGEKIMLAIITKMTLTQVSTWFANARRRLKKENKMQWSPRNRTGEDDDDDDDDKNLGSDIDDDVMDEHRTPRTLCDDSDDIDVGVDNANEDSQSMNDLRVSRLPTSSSFSNRDLDDCPPHCADLLRHRLHFSNNGILPAVPPPQHLHHRGFFWNASAVASSTQSNIDADDDADLAMRRRRHGSSSSSRSSPPRSAIDFTSPRIVSVAHSMASRSLRGGDEHEQLRRSSAVVGSNGFNNNDEDRRPPKTNAAEKPRIWSIADVATSGTSNGRRSSTPTGDAGVSTVSNDSTFESAPATVTSSFQPWAPTLGDLPSPHQLQHHQHHHSHSQQQNRQHHPLNPFRLCIPQPAPPPGSNGVQPLNYAPFPVGTGSGGSPSSAMASHQAALAHQLAAAAAHAAAVHHVRLQQHQQQRLQQQQQRQSPPMGGVKRESSQTSPPVASSRAHPISASLSSVSQLNGGTDVEGRAMTSASDSKYMLNGAQRCGGAGSPATVNADESLRSSPDSRTSEIFMTSREGSPSAGTTAGPTLLKPSRR